MHQILLRGRIAVGLGVIAIALAISFGFGPAVKFAEPPSANADTQYWGLREGRTYRYNWGYYPINFLATTYCAASIYGMTLHWAGSPEVRSAWAYSDKLVQVWWHTNYQWQSGPYGHDYSLIGDISSARVDLHNYNRCTRGYTDHGFNYAYQGTTSDGY